MLYAPSTWPFERARPRYIVKRFTDEEAMSEWMNDMARENFHFIWAGSTLAGDGFSVLMEREDPIQAIHTDEAFLRSDLRYEQIMTISSMEIGPATYARLKSLGISTYSQLAEMTAHDLTKDSGKDNRKIGQRGIRIIKDAMQKRGLTLKNS